MPGPPPPRAGPGIHPHPPRVSRQFLSLQTPSKRQELATHATHPGAPHDRPHRRRPPLARGERLRSHVRPGGRARAHRALRRRRLPPGARGHVPRPPARGRPHRVGAVRRRGPLLRRGDARRPHRSRRPLHARHDRPRRLLHARVVGSIVDYLFVPDDPEAVVAKLADPDTAIVSLTITEGGYGIDDATGAYAPRDEATLADLDGARPRAASWACSPRGSTGGGMPASRRSRSCRATTSRATATSPVRRCSGSPSDATPSWPPGSPRTWRSRTRWSTASPPSPPTRRAPPSPRSSASAIAGRCAASPSSSGCSKTASPPAARRSTRSACNWSTTSSPTSS